MLGGSCPKLIIWNDDVSAYRLHIGIVARSTALHGTDYWGQQTGAAVAAVDFSPGPSKQAALHMMLLLLLLLPVLRRLRTVGRYLLSDRDLGIPQGLLRFAGSPRRNRAVLLWQLLRTYLPSFLRHYLGWAWF